MDKKFTSKTDFERLCNQIAEIEPKFKNVLDQYGYPQLWFRKPDFETLLLTILEQQVSLASAKAAFDKLVEKIKDITPENIMLLSDSELRSCYFSRQKIAYIRFLSAEITGGRLNLPELNKLSPGQIREMLIQLKGIGNWTIDMYLLMSLHFLDIFPAGDLATIKSVYELNLVHPESSKEEIIEYMTRFSPYRSVATYLLWHSYLKKRNKKL
jgi:DNA-3-methyladenine glycosylase II